LLDFVAEESVCGDHLAPEKILMDRATIEPAIKLLLSEILSS
jgi:hypothetical protein